MMEMGLRYPTYPEYPPAGPLSGSSSEGALRMPMMRSDQDPYRVWNLSLLIISRCQ